MLHVYRIQSLIVLVGDRFNPGKFQAMQLPSKAEQRTKIQQYEDAPLSKTANYYLIDGRWFKSWKEYVGYEYEYTAEAESDSPGPIDNSGIQDADGNDGLFVLLRGSVFDPTAIPETAIGLLVCVVTSHISAVPVPSILTFVTV